MQCDVRMLSDKGAGRLFRFGGRRVIWLKKKGRRPADRRLGGGRDNGGKAAYIVFVLERERGVKKGSARDRLQIIA